MPVTRGVIPSSNGATAAGVAPVARAAAVTGGAAVAILALGHTLVDLYGNFVTPLLPRFTELWGLSSTSLGLLAAATSLTGSLLQPVFGFYLDRRGTSRLAALSLLWIAASITALGWVPSFAALFALAAISVLGSAVYHPLGATLALRVAPPDRRGLYMSFYMNVGNMGWAIAPLLVAWYVTAFGLRALGWLILPGLAGAAALAALRLSLADQPPPLVDALPPNASEGGVAEPAEQETAAHRPLADVQPPLPSRRVRHQGVALLVAATTLRSWVATGIQTYLPLYLVQQGHSLAWAGGALTAFILSGTLAGFLVGYLSDRWDRRALYVWTLLLAAAAFSWFLHAPSAWTGAAIVLAGAALLGSIPLTVLLVQEMLPRHTGVGSGLVIGFAGGAGGLMVLLSGALADRLGLRAALGWLVPLLPLAALLAWAIPASVCGGRSRPAAEATGARRT
ncbi:MAG TPA: MFS transporter [Firmicutes bacterium]|nr:MFS transporter [Bacillota bacterium]